MTEFLLQAINSVKDTSWWGRGEGKSCKTVFPRTENLLQKRKGTFHLLSKSTAGKVRLLPFDTGFSGSFMADRNYLMLYQG